MADMSGVPHDTSTELSTRIGAALDAPDDLPDLFLGLVHRLIVRLRASSRADLRNDALVLSQAIASPSGQRLRQTDPVAYGRLEALATIQTTAVFARAPHAVDAVLRDHPHGQRLLDRLVAAPEGRLGRTALREHLGIADGALSRTLGDFELLGLVEHVREDGGFWVRLASEGWARSGLRA